MENQKKYNVKKNSSSPTIKLIEIEAELVRAYAYLDIEVPGLDVYIDALRNEEFKEMTIGQFAKAIENGARGMYGRTYKMCVQEVLIWVRKYQEYNTFKTSVPSYPVN